MHPRAPRPTPACSWHRLPRFTTYGCYPCAFADHLKKPRPCSDALSWSPCSSLEFRTSADGRAAGGWRREARTRRSAAHPQFGTAVWRAGAHFKTLQLSALHWLCFVLLPHTPTLPAPPTFSLVSSSTSISIEVFLVALTSPDWRFFSGQCSSKQMSQAELTFL